MRRLRQAGDCEPAGEACAWARWETGGRPGTRRECLRTGGSLRESGVAVEAVRASIGAGICEVLGVLSLGLSQEAMVCDAALEDNEPLWKGVGALDNLAVNVSARRRPGHVLQEDCTAKGVRDARGWLHGDRSDYLSLQ